MKTYLAGIPTWTDKRWKGLHLSIPATTALANTVRQVPGVDMALRFARYEIRFKVGLAFDVFTICSAVREAVDNLA